eukprot:TRINITY_DN4522_c0_g1_i2.p1 TRINITY_DN4522_c0_g1~~TRINITY_DN4522_c0_g1_i2.p1  ORF type:complete len:169 (+),score=26.93 TRINITY_DN4522_c0_g1_i2:34-540(+)
MMALCLKRGASYWKHLFSSKGLTLQSSNYVTDKEIALRNIVNNSKMEVRLNTLQDMTGARKKKRRVGRGPGTSKGKTSGRGHKGQKARSGGAIPKGFEGGQTPYYKRLKKHGTKNALFRRLYAPLNLNRLQFWIDTGRIDVSKKITMKTLRDSGCVHNFSSKKKLSWC